MSDSCDFSSWDSRERELKLYAEMDKPKRFRVRLPDSKHANGSEALYAYGCYFPKTDLVVGDMGGRGTGKPKDVEWIDVDEDPKCGCLYCVRKRGDLIAGMPLEDCQMILCVKCGNKRCPHATFHGHDCTNSNKTSQPGSTY